jgi:hypothetical protein
MEERSECDSGEDCEICGDESEEELLFENICNDCSMKDLA